MYACWPSLGGPVSSKSFIIARSGHGVLVESGWVDVFDRHRYDAPKISEHVIWGWLRTYVM